MKQSFAIYKFDAQAVIQQCSINQNCIDLNKGYVKREVIESKESFLSCALFDQIIFDLNDLLIFESLL